MSRFNTLYVGTASEAADELLGRQDATTAELRVAVINALTRIDELEKQVALMAPPPETPFTAYQTKALAALDTTVGRSAAYLAIKMGLSHRAHLAASAVLISLEKRGLARRQLDTRTETAAYSWYAQ